MFINVHIFIDKNDHSSIDPISRKELKLIQSASDIQNPEVIIFGVTHIIE